MEIVNLTFNLHHLDECYSNTILYNSGWSNITDYDTYVVNNSRYNEFVSFPLTLKKYNGQYLLCNDIPQPNPQQYYVCRLMVHTLTDSVKYILFNTMGINITEFEMKYTKYNSIYVTIPYKKWFMEEYLKDLEHSSENVQTSNEIDSHDSESMDYDSEYDLDKESGSEYDTNKNEKHTNGLLSDFTLKINPVTKNSYILYRTSGSSKNDESPWNLLPDYRPLYYSNKYQGYIVGMSQKNKLSELGAMEEVD